MLNNAISQDLSKSTKLSKSFKLLRLTSKISNLSR